jgi:UDPglucose 6-dehydrogenase
LAALIQAGERVGYPVQVALAASKVNDDQRHRMVDKIRDAVGGLKGKTLGLLGLSFKPNTNDLREAPALAISQELLKEGATVRAYDPIALDEACRTISALQPCIDAYDAAEGTDALIIMTEWNQFRSLDFEKLKGIMKSPVLIDLRNVYDPDRVVHYGFHYVSVGRSSKRP